MWGYLQKPVQSLRAGLASNKFFGFILVVVILQALWYAVSFVPWVNDESQHFRITELYTAQLSPFIAEQPESWDKAGAVSRNGSYLFYYLMSWPLRLLQLLSDDRQLQLLGLRLMMLVIFVVGVILYRQTLLKIKALSQAAVNGILLVFALVPAAGLIAGMYNYDVAIFTLLAGMLYLAVKVIQARQVLAAKLLLIIWLAGVTILIKWAAVALVLPLILYLAYDQISRFKADFLKQFWQQFKTTKALVKVAIVVGLLLVSGLVIERHGQNLWGYGKINPSCDVVLSHQRCMKSGTYSSYQKTLSHKSEDFSPLPLPAYALRHWIPRMADSSTNLFEKGLETRLPLAFGFYLVVACLSLLVVLLRITSIWKVKEFRLFVVIGAVYVGVLMVKEYMIYSQYGIPGAVRARYLLVLLPLYFAVLVYAILPLIRRYRTQAAVVGCLALLVLITQGGGIISHLVVAPRSAYVSESAYQANQALKAVVQPVVVLPKP